MNYQIRIKASFSCDKEFKIFHTIDVPITSVCPCSKIISKYGAHNQRGIISVTLDGIDVSDYSDIIRVIEISAPSQEIYSILKRSDEKYVTEHAYENPKFVEDLVRDTLIGLNNTYAGKVLSVKVKNFESIHNHNVYAYIIATQ